MKEAHRERFDFIMCSSSCLTNTCRKGSDPITTNTKRSRYGFSSRCCVLRKIQRIEFYSVLKNIRWSVQNLKKIILCLRFRFSFLYHSEDLDRSFSSQVRILNLSLKVRVQITHKFVCFLLLYMYDHSLSHVFPMKNDIFVVTEVTK